MTVNGEREQPAIDKSNLKSILVFVKHSPGLLNLCNMNNWKCF